MLSFHPAREFGMPIRNPNTESPIFPDAHSLPDWASCWGADWLQRRSWLPPPAGPNRRPSPVPPDPSAPTRLTPAPPRPGDHLTTPQRHDSALPERSAPDGATGRQRTHRLAGLRLHQPALSGLDQRRPSLPERQHDQAIHCTGVFQQGSRGNASVHGLSSRPDGGDDPAQR